MNYFKTKTEGRWEWRIYPASEEVEGSVLYKGHRLGVESSVLQEIIDYRVEKSTGKIYLLDYSKVESDNFDLSNRIQSRAENLEANLIKSWETLQTSFLKEIGKTNKIIITRVNI